MKISGLQENLKQGFLTVGHIAGRNASLQILNNVLIEAGAGKIKLITTNLEMGVSCLINGKVDEEGAFTVDSKIIADYISLLPNKKIDIEQSGSSLIIKTDNYKTKILGQVAEEFPLLPQIDRSEFYSTKINEFKKAVSGVVFAASNNELRVELSGVFFNFAGRELILAATDSYRLAEKRIGLKGAGGAKKAIVPAKTVQEVIRILGGQKADDDEEEIKFYVSENQIVFSFGSTEVVSRTIEGHYPDYEQIIPASPATEAAIDRQEAVRAIKAASLFSKTGVNDIGLRFFPKNKQIQIYSASDQTGESEIEIEAEIKGREEELVVNYRYFLDGLNNINEETIKIEITDANTPCVLRPEKERDYIYIIMPIKK